jgi:hypothetical protein
MRQRFGSWMLSIPLLVACAPEDEAVSGQALALTAQGNVERALRGLYDAGSFVADSASLAEILSPIAAGDVSCVDVVPTCPVGQVCPPAESDCEPEEVTVADLQDGRQDAKEAIDELVDTLREKIFTDARTWSQRTRSQRPTCSGRTYCVKTTTVRTFRRQGARPHRWGRMPRTQTAWSRHKTYKSGCG